jgi:lysozyme
MHLDIAYRASKFIMKYEGFRAKPYFATDEERKRGLLTIGYGFTHLKGRNVLPTDEMTKEEAEALLTDDVESLLLLVDNLVDVELSPNQYIALVSLVFNIGLPAFRGSTLLRVLNQGKYMEAAKQFPRWVYQGKLKLNGLATRREAEKQLFVTV